MENFIETLAGGVADVGMILGPCLGYIMQTMTMMQTGQADGFSPFVSFILIVSNLIRVFWWYSERFLTVVFLAAVVMILCQLSLLYIWVKLTNNSKEKSSNTLESFWHWRSFQKYLQTLGVMTTVLLAAMIIGCGEEWFNVLLGTLSSGIEALLGVPQFWLNCSRGHTTGLAVSLIGMWLFGDLYKVSYYQSQNAPLQLVLAAFFSCSCDLAILFQFWFFRHKNAEIQAKVTAQMKANLENDKLEKGAMPNNGELTVNTTMTSAVSLNPSSRRSSAESASNLVEMDSYFGDSDAGLPENRRPLSPHIVTIQENANRAFSKRDASSLHNTAAAQQPTMNLGTRHRSMSFGDPDDESSAKPRLYRDSVNSSTDLQIEDSVDQQTSTYDNTSVINFASPVVTTETSDANMSMEKNSPGKKPSFFSQFER